MVFAAIDWSGAKARGGARDIALAEAADERLVDIRVGLSRTDVERWLLRRATSARELVVGLDFAFSLPAWFAHEKLSATSVDDVWAIVEAEGEQWLDGSAPWPFWGRGERPDSTRLPVDRALRHTDRDVAVLTGAQPKSVFQLVGTGHVGPGSIRGMPMLRRLRAQGFAVWPFDAFSTPLLVEIYPRVFTGNVVKSNPVARQHYLSLLGDVGPREAAAAASSEHAFDAACSALAMARQAGMIEQLARQPSPYDIEGKMWLLAVLSGLQFSPATLIGVAAQSVAKASQPRRMAGRRHAPASKRPGWELANGLVLQVIRAALTEQGTAAPEVGRSSPSRTRAAVAVDVRPSRYVALRALAPGLPTQNSEGPKMWLSSRFGGDLSMRKRDLDAGAAEVDHRDQCVGRVESVGAV
jgi:hypothetical protein